MTRSQARRLQSVRRWHRRGALVIALWMVVLALTGSAINRAHDWGLDRVALPALLQSVVYGIDVQGDDPCAGLDPVPDGCGRAFARLATDDGSILLTPHSAVLLGPDGQQIEAVPAGQLGLPRIDAGLGSGRWIFLRGGPRTVAADSGLLTLREPEPAELAALQDADWRPSAASVAPATITWERLLLDLHAARFLGPAARWFTDLMAASILLLVLSGLWLYRLRGRNEGR
ncbi:MAG: PepSY domain-containing protein [Xanthomonadales bacterium]